MTPQAAAKRIRIIRLAAASCAAVLVAVLCICQVATPPSQVEPRYPADGSINRELVMVLCALAVTGWGYSVRLRCSSAETMRCLLAVATLLFFWLALTVAKWNVQSSIAGSIMWYLFYLPMLAVPTFVLFSIVPQTKWGSSPRARWARAACFAIDGVLLVLVLTNNLHHAVFDFDLSDPEWSSAYAYAPGYAVVYIWIIVQYLGFLVIAFVNARKDLRKTLVVVGFFLVVGAAYSILYVLGTSFPLNLTTVQSLLVMIGMECALELGILPSYAWYGALFKTVPYDVRVLDGKGRVFAQSDVAKPLPEHLAARAVRVAGHSDGPVTLHLSKTPRSSYTVYAVLGGYALARKDVSSLVEQRAQLERQRSQLKRRNRALSHQSELERTLARQREEARIADGITETLAEKVARIDNLLDALPDDPALARGQLAQAKLLVSWCKQQGALALGGKEGSAATPESLRLGLGQIASDMRGVGIECGTLVDVARPVSTHAASAVYDCLYELADVACCLDDAVVMLYVQQAPAPGDVRIRGVLQCAETCAEALGKACRLLESPDEAGQSASVSFEDAAVRVELLVREEAGS